jgi:NADPH:quinone reductase-like Zn-dependent oxidoreductase
LRAVVHDSYGPPEVLRLDDVPQPHPEDGEVLVRVHATTVNRTDTGVRQGKPLASRMVTGLRKPKHRILGTEFSGEVVGAGAAVTRFADGDCVFGLNPWRFGTHAEYVCIRESAPIAHKPERITFQDAAAICDGGLLALMNLRRAGLRRGQHVLIYGASGSIGTAALQLAVAIGAVVTAVCNTSNVEVVKELGARQVVDYTREDFTANGQTYAIIFDAVGKHSFRQSRNSLEPNGVFVGSDGLRNPPAGEPWRSSHRTTRRGMPSSWGSWSNPGGIERSSTAAIRWMASSRPPGTWRPSRRRGTWSCG